MKPHKMWKWKTIKKIKNYKAKKHNVLKSQVIWDHTMRDYIPNTNLFKSIHTRIGSQLN
jgi:hypothetical protein